MYDSWALHRGEAYVVQAPTLTAFSAASEKSLASSSGVFPSDVETQVASGQSDEKGRWRRFHPSPRMISDAIIGLSDGLTVPFALTAGLSAFNDAQIVVLGGLAELIAGAISMGLGGFIGAKSEAYVPLMRWQRCKSE